jgi:hypothetical protein
MAERTYRQTFQVAADQLLGAVKEILHQGNVRRVIITQDGRMVVDFPLTGTVLAPVMVASARYKASYG